MDNLTLTAQPRTTTGKGAARRMREAGQLPAVLYQGRTARAITLSTRETERLVQGLKGRERLIALQLDGKSHHSILKEVQQSAYGGKLLHIDFQQVDLKQVVEVNVAVHPQGQPIGIRFGGMLQKVTRYVSVRCLPTEIPDHLTSDVENMQIGHSRHASDIELPEGVQLLTPAETTVFIVTGRMVEETETETQEDTEEAAEETDDA